MIKIVICLRRADREHGDEDNRKHEIRNLYENFKNYAFAGKEFKTVDFLVILIYFIVLQ